MWRLQRAVVAVAALALLGAAAPPVPSASGDQYGDPYGVSNEDAHDVAPGKPRGKYDWESWYGYWRHTDEVSLATWRARIPPPVPRLLNVSTLNALPDGEKAELFHACLGNQAKSFSAHVLRYKSPKLAEVTAAVGDLQ
jgi:hypothetical protein